MSEDTIITWLNVDRDRSHPRDKVVNSPTRIVVPLPESAEILIPRSRPPGRDRLARLGKPTEHVDVRSTGRRSTTREDFLCTF